MRPLETCLKASTFRAVTTSNWQQRYDAIEETDSPHCCQRNRQCDDKSGLCQRIWKWQSYLIFFVGSDRSREDREKSRNARMQRNEKSKSTNKIKSNGIGRSSNSAGSLIRGKLFYYYYDKTQHFLSIIYC